MSERPAETAQTAEAGRSRVVGASPFGDWPSLSAGGRDNAAQGPDIARVGAILAAVATAGAAVIGTVRRIAHDHADGTAPNTPRTPSAPVTVRASVTVNAPAADVRRLAEQHAIDNGDAHLGDLRVTVEELAHDRGTALHLAARVDLDEQAGRERLRALARRTKAVAECGEVLVG